MQNEAREKAIGGIRYSWNCSEGTGKTQRYNLHAYDSLFEAKNGLER